MTTEARNTFGHLIEVDLSDDEIKAQLERNADIDRKMITIKGEKAAANSGFNEDLKTLRKEQETLLSSINTGKAKTEVECYHEKDERRGMMLTRRADNGFIVDERALTVDELNADNQGELFPERPAPAPSDEEFTGDASDAERPADADAASALASYQNAVGDSDEDGDGDADADDDDVEAAPAVN